MTTKKAVKKEVVKKLPKEAPNNNKEQAPTTEKQPPVPPKPESFTISAEGVDELVKALNDTVASKYVKQVLFNVINEHFKPNFPKEK